MKLAFSASHDALASVCGPAAVGLKVCVCVCACVLGNFSAGALVRHRGKSSSAISCGSPLSGLVDRPAFPPYFLALFLSFHPTSPPTLSSIT